MSAPKVHECWNFFKMKKAQITLFMIIGLFLLLSLGLFLYYKSAAEEKPVVLQAIDTASLTSYVESCIEATGKEVVETVALQGGIYEPVFYKTYQGANISYWCYGESPNQCVNALLLKEDIAAQIILGIRDKLPNCFDFKTMEQQGYTITEGSFDSTVIIRKDAIDISLEYPITMKKKDEEAIAESFHATLQSSLGELYDTALFILNQEATEGLFDTTDFVINHTDISIEKQKPYPATIYVLQKKDNERNDFIMQFAIQGLDTAENPGEVLLGKQETLYGCCYAGAENNCYANTPSIVCKQKQGRYETAPCTCDEPAELKENKQHLCNNKDCSDCGTRKHGESWCGYDRETGKGKDATGSRHVLYFCSDGKIMEELCREYREEICVEEDTFIDNEKATKALCRPNRWQDCAACSTESCCENTEERDCYWNEALASLESSCVPYVPPGFKFWEFKGAEICSRATTEKTCSGLYCSQEWVNAGAISCSSQGDCGNWRNTENILTEKGFFTTNMRYDPEEEIYDWRGEAEPITSLPLHIKKQTLLLEAPTAESADLFVEMLSAAYRFVNQWVDITVPNYLNPFTKHPKIEVLEINYCSTWQAPNTDEYCGQCDAEGMGRCTEYKCRSLGKKCVYEETNGYSFCAPVSKEKQKPFTIKLDAAKLPTSFTAEKTMLSIDDKNYSGYAISPALTPYKLFTVAIETSTATICHLDYVPQTEYFDPPVFMFGTAEYAIQHNITMRVPPGVSIPEKLKTGLNLTTGEAIFDAITAPEELLENYEEKFPAVFSTYETITGNDLAEELEPYVKKAEQFIEEVQDTYPFYENMSITLLDKWNSNGYYLFVTCEDRYGNAQENEFFIEINISNTTEDTTAPSIVAFAPENNGEVAAAADAIQVFLYIDEPAECRYDKEDKEYQAMEYAFTCKNEIYDLVSVAGGSYECSTTLETEENTTIFIRCADNPGMTETYLFAIQGSFTNSVEGQLYTAAIPESVENPLEEYAAYIAVEENNETNSSNILVSGYLLSDTSVTIFNTTKQNTTVHLYIDEKRECVLTEKATETATEVKISLQCEETANAEQQKGLYDCATEVSISLPTEEREENETLIFPEAEEYEISCKAPAKEQNVNEKAVVYSLVKSESLQIKDITPKNNEEVEKKTALTVTTTDSEEIICGYATYGSLEFIEMKKATETVFTAMLSDLEKGYNTFSIYCRDAYGNSVEEIVTFYVK